MGVTKICGIISLLLIAISYNVSFSQQLGFDSSKIQQDSLVQHPTEISLNIDISMIPNPNTEEIPKAKVRSGYGYLTIGLVDIIGVGVGYQIDDYYSIGIKWGSYWTNGGFILPGNRTGFGIRISRALNSRIMNNVNFEATLFYSHSSSRVKNLIKGGEVEINFGNECNFKNGFNIIWSFGLVKSFVKGYPPLFMPSIKIGLNINI